MQSDSRVVLIRIVVALAMLLTLLSIHQRQANASGAREPKNSWRGIVPLQSSAEDVGRLLGVEADPAEAPGSSAHQVEDGEVTFFYLTPSLAKIYHAPRSYVSKVFSIYFKPKERLPREAMRLPPTFKRCVEEYTKTHYYMICDDGIAYQFTRGADQLETIIYQPTRVQIRSLAVSTECVF